MQDDLDMRLKKAKLKLLKQLFIFLNMLLMAVFYMCIVQHKNRSAL